MESGFIVSPFGVYYELMGGVMGVVVSGLVVSRGVGSGPLVSRRAALGYIVSGGLG